MSQLKTWYDYMVVQNDQYDLFLVKCNLICITECHGDTVENWIYYISMLCWNFSNEYITITSTTLLCWSYDMYKDYLIFAHLHALSTTLQSI